jgi:hypothetical protein
MPLLHLSRLLQMRSPEHIAVLKARAQTLLAREYRPGTVQSAWLDLTETGMAILVVSLPADTDRWDTEAIWGLDDALEDGR